ncbi:uncharacterized protein DS421_20g693290 [Arachis hypogaea]|nr:uncharacterized protein DS421_20g693290 [Arachis hypogaea]
MGYEKETKGEVDWSYDWVNDDVRDRIFLFLDIGAVNEIDKSKVARANSGVRLELLPCTVDDRVFHRGEGFEHFFMYSCVLEELRVRIPFSDFECKVLKQLNCAPSQLHPNGWTFLRAFEILIEFLEENPSVELFFSLFQAKGVWKGGWVNLNSSPGFGVFKLYKSSFKNFKEMYLKWEENKAAVIDYLGGKYSGVSAASLRSRVKSKGLDKEVSWSKADKVGVGEVDQPRPGRRKVIAKKRKGDVVDLSDVSDDEKDDVLMEEVHMFCDNQKKLHGFVEQSEGSSLWGKHYPFMITADEVCQTPSDVSLAEEVGDVAIDQYMQVTSIL